MYYWQTAVSAVISTSPTAVPGFHTKVVVVVTTLLDAEVFSPRDLAELYRCPLARRVRSAFSEGHPGDGRTSANSFMVCNVPLKLKSRGVQPISSAARAISVRIRLYASKWAQISLRTISGVLHRLSPQPLTRCARAKPSPVICLAAGSDRCPSGQRPSGPSGTAHSQASPKAIPAADAAAPHSPKAAGGKVLEIGEVPFRMSRLE
jgi:hypothetical protein